MGRPVILPHTNVGRFVRHGVHAWVLPKVDALGITETINHLRSNQELVERLSAGALQFYQEHFDWETSSHNLQRFYTQVLGARVKSNEQSRRAENALA